MSNPYLWLEHDLSVLHRAQWYRAPIVVSNDILQLGSNNYLGLAHDIRLKQAAIDAIQIWGTGTTGSRLLSGNLPIHHTLEKAIAQLKNTEDALVFSSGYLANLGAIGALVGKRDLILGDALNHACLQQGSMLSGAKTITYPHCNMPSLATLLSQYRADFRRCLIVTDSVFSMDGDIAPLATIVNLAKTYEAMVLVDEAHATGVLGEQGGGITEMLGINTPIVQVGTLSKALGSQGGFVAGSHTLIDYLRNRTSTWIYTTGLSPANTAAALAAINILRSEPTRKDKLWQNLRFLEQCFSANSFRFSPIVTPIVTLQVGDITKTLQIYRSLLARGIFVPAIRPPTVSTARLRISLTSSHTTTDIDRFVKSLCEMIDQ